MMQGLYIGASGLKTHGEGLSIVSHNIANVNTVGYKQQLMLFQDMMYQGVSAGSYEVMTSAKGLGSSLGVVRTLFNDGAYQPGSSAVDLAISGKGFFQVVDDDGSEFYTRAGNFVFDANGVLRNTSGMAVSGIRMQDGKATGEPGEIVLNLDDAALSSDPAKASTSMTAIMNINVSSDVESAPGNPFFSLLQSWDGTQEHPLSDTDYSQSLTFYDSTGTERAATMHFDHASTVNGQTTLEYIVTIPPEQDARANAKGTAGAGLLMAGTLTFSSNGELINMSAFTPNGGDLKDLSNWTPAALDANGVPQFTASFAGQTPQTISLNLGIRSGGGWAQAPASAADVGTNRQALPSMVSPSYAATRTTALPYTSALSDFRQDGYPQGALTDVYVDDSGILVGTYSNGQSHDLYQIPLYRFSSEDGLRREGNNLYSATLESGNVEYGMAGTENYGTVMGSYLETSNVDMSKEMVNMIVVQRGFQSNSKSITTVDAMIQRALELKRY